MKNNQKNTLFLSSALQDSLNRISHMYDGYLQTIFSSDSITSQIGQLQEEMVKSYKHFFQLYTPSIISSLTNSLSITCRFQLQISNPMSYLGKLFS